MVSKRIFLLNMMFIMAMSATISCQTAPDDASPRTRGALYSIKTDAHHARTHEMHSKKDPHRDDSLEGDDPQSQDAHIEEQRRQFIERLQALAEAEQWSAALDLFDDLPHEIQNEANTLNLKLSLLISAERYVQAHVVGHSAEEKYPKNVPILLSLAMLASAEGNAKVHKKYLDAVLAIEPNNEVALINLGLWYYSQRNYAFAEKTFRKVLATHPQSVHALLGLGQIMYLNGNLDEAEKQYQRIEELDPHNIMARAEWARIKAETKRLDEAITDMREIVQEESDNPTYWTDLGMYTWQSGNRSEANEAFKQAAALDPQGYFSYIYLAGINDDLGNKDEALEYYKKVTELYPQYYFAYEGLGVLLWEKDDWQGAGEAFYNAYLHNTGNMRYALMISLCYDKLNDRAKAKSFMQRAIRSIDKEKNEALYFVCRLFIDNTGEADAYNRIVKEKDDTLRRQLMFYLGEYYALKDKPTLAHQCLLDVKSARAPGFFEYRLAMHLLDSPQAE